MSNPETVLIEDGREVSADEYREMMPGRLEEGIVRGRYEYTDEDLTRILGKTIKGNPTIPKLLFIGLLNTYTESGQENFSLTGKSSAGKTWIALQIIQYFPAESVEKIGYASPTSFYYRYGDYDEEEHVRIIDLRQRIILWLDQPHFKLLERLRPILSKDEPQISYQITDKNKRGSNRQLKILIKGFFSTVFCSAFMNMKGQERTRFVHLSPDSDQETIRHSLEQVNAIEVNPAQFWKAFEEDPDVSRLKGRVRDIKEANIENVVIPPELASYIIEDFHSKRPNLKARHRRDLKHLYSVIKGYALLNFKNRHMEGNDVEANLQDIENGIRLYESIRKANEEGVSPEVFSIFTKIIQPTGQHGITKREIQRTHFDQTGERIGKSRLENILASLEDTGLLVKEVDANDRRRYLYIPNSGKIDTEYIPTNGGTHLETNADIPPITRNISLQEKQLKLDEKEASG